MGMPIIPGQGSGLVAGLVILAFYCAAYNVFVVGRPLTRLGRSFVKPLSPDKKNKKWFQDS